MATDGLAPASRSIFAASNCLALIASDSGSLPRCDTGTDRDVMRTSSARAFVGLKSTKRLVRSAVAIKGQASHSPDS